MPYEPLCREFENEFFKHGNRSIHFGVNLFYQSEYEIKRAIEWYVFHVVFICDTMIKAAKVKIRFLNILSILDKVNAHIHYTIRKSFKICIKRDL